MPATDGPPESGAASRESAMPAATDTLREFNQPRYDEAPLGDEQLARAQEIRIADRPILGDTGIVERTQSDDRHPVWPVSTV